VTYELAIRSSNSTFPIAAGRSATAQSKFHEPDDPCSGAEFAAATILPASTMRHRWSFTHPCTLQRQNLGGTDMVFIRVIIPLKRKREKDAHFKRASLDDLTTPSHS
jgi:hypothetical protein